MVERKSPALLHARGVCAERSGRRVCGHRSSLADLRFRHFEVEFVAIVVDDSHLLRCIEEFFELSPSAADETGSELSILFQPQNLRGHFLQPLPRLLAEDFFPESQEAVAVEVVRDDAYSPSLFLPRLPTSNCKEEKEAESGDERYRYRPRPLRDDEAREKQQPRAEDEDHDDDRLP